MTDNKWHDINELSMSNFWVKKDEKPEIKKTINRIDDNDEKPKPPPVLEVDIIKAEKWIKGKEGFRFEESRP